MAVFRIEKTKDYTVMSNYHLKDRELSCKACGLLSKMLSLPEDWDYTTRGLATICKDGVDSIGTALKELEKRGPEHLEARLAVGQIHFVGRNDLRTVAEITVGSQFCVDPVIIVKRIPSFGTGRTDRRMGCAGGNQGTDRL